MSVSDDFSSPRRPHGRAAAVGALALAAVLLLLWATSAAQTLPDGAPDFVRDFTPAHGMVRLTAGLLLAGATGAMLGLLAAGLWRLAKALPSLARR